MKYLRHPLVSAFGILLLLIADLFHSGTAYTLAKGINSPWYTQLDIITLNLAIHIALFIQTIHGKQLAAGSICLMVTILNLFYFWYGIPFVSWEFTDLIPYIPGGIGAIMLGVLMYNFVEVFISDMEEDQLLKSTIQDRDNWRKQSLEQGKEVSKLKKQIGQLSGQLESQTEKVENAKKLGIDFRKLEEKVREQKESFDAALELILQLEKHQHRSPDSIRKTLNNWKRKLREEQPKGEELSKVKLKIVINERALTKALETDNLQLKERVA